jgi:hypothetical protein
MSRQKAVRTVMHECSLAILPEEKQEKQSGRQKEFGKALDLSITKMSTTDPNGNSFPNGFNQHLRRLPFIVRGSVTLKDKEGFGLQS